MTTATDPSTVSFEVKLSFPLPDGRTVVQGPLTYESDGLFTTNRCDFIAEPRFREAYRLGNHTGHKFRENPDDLHIEWRVHVLCWAATQALRQEGDFVECGVNTGIFSRAPAAMVFTSGLRGHPGDIRRNQAVRCGTGARNQAVRCGLPLPALAFPGS